MDKQYERINLLDSDGNLVTQVGTLKVAKSIMSSIRVKEQERFYTFNLDTNESLEWIVSADWFDVVVLKEPQQQQTGVRKVEAPLTVIAGTMKIEEEIDSCMAILKEHHPEAHKRIERELEHNQDSYTRHLIFYHDIWLAMEDVCPSGYAFGAAEGDGADLGFYPIEPAW